MCDSEMLFPIPNWEVAFNYGSDFFYEAATAAATADGSITAILFLALAASIICYCCISIGAFSILILFSLILYSLLS